MNESRPSLSVSFHNFHPGFDPGNSFFARALGDRYDLAIERAGRDVQISSVFGSEPLPAASGGRALRVWYSGEAADPHHQLFDLHFGFRPHMPLLRDRWFRYPNWVMALDWWDPQAPSHHGRLTAPRQAAERPKFCNFIYSATPSIRAEFFMRLNAARPVDSYGAILNNTGRRPAGIAGKIEVLERCAFTIAFENQIAPGYVTEKLVEPLLAGSIPIYWGDAQAGLDFNPQAFIAAAAFDTMDDLVRHVLAIADSPDRRLELTSAPPLPDNRLAYEFTPAFFVDRIAEALSGPVDPVVADRKPWLSRSRSMGKRLEARLRRLRRARR